MIPVPWRDAENWSCLTCGRCCRLYDVVIRFDEWLKLVNIYGSWVAKPSLNKFYLQKRNDGACIFLGRFGNRYYCGLQKDKPKACKLWPFRVLNRPKYGRAEEAAYRYGDRIYYIYITPTCSGVRWGTPSIELTKYMIPEFIGIALGINEKQYYSTCRRPYWYTIEIK